MTTDSSRHAARTGLSPVEVDKLKRISEQSGRSLTALVGYAIRQQLLRPKRADVLDTLKKAA